MPAVLVTGPTVMQNSLFLPCHCQWSRLIVPTHGRMVRLSRPGWLIKFQDGIPVNGHHLSTNTARHGVLHCCAQCCYHWDKLPRIKRPEFKNYVWVFYATSDWKHALVTECSLKALADKVALKWQKYLQFKAEIYLAYVGLFIWLFLFCWFCIAEFCEYYL